MSERGVFAVDRGIWDHPVLSSREPFSRREAWMWLISEAAWKPCRRRVGSATVEMERGELAHSVRFIANAWGWPKSSVARFLKTLKTETMIGTKTGQGLTVLSICNYDEYQRVSLPDRDNNGTATGTRVGQQRDRLEDTKDTKRRILVSEDSKNERFQELRKSYPKRKGGDPSAPAAKLFLAAVKAGTDPQIIIDGAKRFAVEEFQNINTPYIPQLVKWLRDKRWLDYANGTSAAPIIDIRSHIIS